MGYKIGMPSMKLSNVQGKGGKHCGNFRNVAREALSERFGHDRDIDRDRTADNEYLTDIKSAAQLLELSKEWISNYNQNVDTANEQMQELIAKYNEAHGTALSGKKALKAINAERAAAGQSPLKLGRHIRADATVMCATVIKPSAEYMATLSKKDQRKLLHDAFEKLCEIVGEENMIAAVIHNDELNAHLHAFWMPQTADGRLCAKEMHSLKFFGRLNREMPAYLRQQGWDVSDCHAYDVEEEQKLREEMGDAAYRDYKDHQRSKCGRDSVVFKHEAQAAVNALTNQRGKQQLEIAELQKQIEALKACVCDLTIPEQPKAPKKPDRVKPQDSKEKWIESALDTTLSFWGRHKQYKKLEQEYDEQIAEWNIYEEKERQYRSEYTKWLEQADTVQALQRLFREMREDQEVALRIERTRISVKEHKLMRQVSVMKKEIEQYKQQIEALQPAAETVETQEKSVPTMSIPNRMERF